MTRAILLTLALALPASGWADVGEATLRVVDGTGQTIPAGNYIVAKSTVTRSIVEKCVRDGGHCWENLITTTPAVYCPSGCDWPERRRCKHCGKEQTREWEDVR